MLAGVPRVVSCTRLAHVMTLRANQNIIMKNVRLFATEKAEMPKQMTEFIPAYMFPGIRVARMICKLKLAQTGVVACIAGVSIATNTEVELLLASGGIALVMLGIMGEFFRKLIGIIYLDPKTDRVKISHLNFWGNRVDKIFNVNDIIPISDTKEVANNIFVKLQFYDKDLKPLYLSIKLGKILDKKSFHRVVGEF